MKKVIYIALVLSSLFLTGCSSIGNHSHYNSINYRPTIAQQSYGTYQPASYRSVRRLSPQRLELMKVAHRSMGTRYTWGGNSPREGFDCSGLMQHTFKTTGINIPRTAAQQRDASRRISRSDLQPGDMIFFKTGRNANHVGVYTGNGEFIHASTGSKRVKKDRLSSSYWQQRIVKFGTFL